MIQIDNLSFSYHNGTLALKNINLTVNKGDFLLILGPNGGGKSTLLKLMTGLLKPKSGTIRLFDHDIEKVRHRIGYLPQNASMNPNFPISVFDTVKMGWQGSRKSRFFHTRQEKQAVLEALEKVGMQSYQSRRIGELSGGQRQRVLIARAMVTHPDLIFLDEPTASIDPSAKTTFYQLLDQLKKDVTVVMVSHDISFIPAAAKSVACVNKTLHYHPEPEITQEMLNTIAGKTSLQAQCPIEVLGHGLPHRVVQSHSEEQE